MDRDTMRKLALTIGVEQYSFNPLENANDCNALIKHLTGLGYLVTIEHGERIHVCVRNDNIVYDWRQKSDRYDWMHGVCEIALKVLNESD